MVGLDAVCVNPQHQLSNGGSFKIPEKSVVGEPYTTQNGVLYPKLKDGDDLSTRSKDSDNNTEVDSGISTGSDTSSDSKDSSDSTTPLLDHTQKPPTDETVNSCRIGSVEKRPLIPTVDPLVTSSTKDPLVYPQDTDPCASIVITDERGPSTTNNVSIHGGPESGEEDLGKHTNEEPGPYEIHCEKPPLKKDSSWKKIVIIFSVLDILLFITILVVSCSVPTRSPASVTGGESCLECKDVYLTEDDRRDNIYNFRMKKGGKLCCSKNQTRLIQKYVLKRYKQDYAEESAARYEKMPKRTAVHVDLDLQDKNSVSEGVNQVLKWSRKDALMNGHLTLTPDGKHIQCAHTGLYYINSKVVFRDTMPSASTKHTVLLLQVYRVRERQTLLLLESKSSQCCDADRDCNVPSSAQGVFNFLEGDQVFVNVTKPRGLVLEARYNYLEMYLV